MAATSHNSNSANLAPVSNESNQRRCAACKYLRRRCSEDCVLAPYFPASLPDRFACVHKIFGSSNVARMLQQLPVHLRAQAAEAMSVEAYWRVKDSVYGSVGVINLLQQEIHLTQLELARTRAQIAMRAAQQEAHLSHGAGPWAAHESASFVDPPQHDEFAPERSSSTSLGFNYFP